MSEAQEVPKITGQIYLYENPELLTVQNHGDLGLRPAAQAFSFAAKARALPLTYSEVPTAMKDYPLIFMDQEDAQLLAVTGLFDDINLFVEEDGSWDRQRYVPGYARRYPFGLAAEEGGDRMAVVIDRAFEGLTTDAEKRLFVDGQPTQDTVEAMEFCKSYERDRQMTIEFAKKMKELELIQPQSVSYTPQGGTEPVTFAKYVGIDEKRLNALPDDKILELRKSSMLPLIYAMLMSMGNWRILLQRRARRFNLTEADIFKSMVN